MNFAPHLSTRRELLLGSGALFAWAYMPKVARAEGRDPRFLVIVLRGALDGLATVAPIGDPDWQKLRGDKALLLDGEYAALKLDGFFALNPAMPNFYRMYQAQQAAIVHAVATPYRERSHFDGQDVLESGLPIPARAKAVGSIARGACWRPAIALPDGKLLRSGLLRRSWHVARLRLCPGRLPDCSRRAMTR